MAEFRQERVGKKISKKAFLIVLILAIVASGFLNTYPHLYLSWLVGCDTKKIAGIVMLLPFWFLVFWYLHLSRTEEVFKSDRKFIPFLFALLGIVTALQMYLKLVL